MLLENILAKSPWVEVLVRSVYWRSSLVNRLLAARAKKIQKPNSTVSAESCFIDFSQVLSEISALGVKPGSILIVHSSGSELKPTGLKPVEIIDELLRFIGPTGTLAVPCIPFYKEEPVGISRLSDDICQTRLTYDVKRTPTWTGALSKALMNYAGAVRSRHPLNSMAAVGAVAERMMEGNIAGDKPLPCGPTSSWKYCADHDASIVCLGVDMAHSLTMIHVAEDAWADEWPIKNWYRERLFRVIDGDYEEDVTIRERRPKWAINYAERTLQSDLISNGVLKKCKVGSLNIEVCSSKKLLEFLRSRNQQGYPYYFPFWDRLFK